MTHIGCPNVMLTDYWHDPFSFESSETHSERTLRPRYFLLGVQTQHLAYPLSIRNLDDMMAERSISADHSTVNR
jgi:hypothetical protein